SRIAVSVLCLSPGTALSQIICRFGGSPGGVATTMPVSKVRILITCGGGTVLNVEVSKWLTGAALCGLAVGAAAAPFSVKHVDTVSGASLPAGIISGQQF